MLKTRPILAMAAIAVVCAVSAPVHAADDPQAPQQLPWMGCLPPPAEYMPSGQSIFEGCLRCVTMQCNSSTSTMPRMACLTAGIAACRAAYAPVPEGEGDPAYALKPLWLGALDPVTNEVTSMTPVMEPIPSVNEPLVTLPPLDAGDVIPPLVILGTGGGLAYLANKYGAASHLALRPAGIFVLAAGAGLTMANMLQAASNFDYNTNNWVLDPSDPYASATCPPGQVVATTVLGSSCVDIQVPLIPSCSTFQTCDQVLASSGGCVVSDPAAPNTCPPGENILFPVEHTCMDGTQEVTRPNCLVLSSLSAPPPPPPPPL